MSDSDICDSLVDQVKLAVATNTGLSIVGGGSQGFLCPGRSGEAVEVSQHRGIIDYQPTELSLQVRAGTPVSELRKTLAEQGQMLAFEPAEADGKATIGGVVATALAGPRRGYVGGVADYVLGVTLLNGRGQVLRFGGQVMKNVAGFDVSRYVVGGFGCSGILLDISFKVIPIPACEKTFLLPAQRQELSDLHARLRGLPISASSYYNAELRLRLSAGSEDSINYCAEKLQGEELSDADDYWRQLRERQTSFFTNRNNLTLCLMPAAEDLDVAGEQLIEWQGAKRWVADSSLPLSELRELLTAKRGHLLSFIASVKTATAASHQAHPELSPLQSLQQRLRLAFDPQCLFNRGQTLLPWLEAGQEDRD